MEGNQPPGLDKSVFSVCSGSSLVYMPEMQNT